MLKDIKKFLSVCIVGKPNAGKSTLLNYIIGKKISIVTPKVQTTTSIITGIITSNDLQIVLLDTPGIVAANKKNVSKAIIRCIWSSIQGVDMIVLIIDGTIKIEQDMVEIIHRLTKYNKSITILLNKIDIKSQYTVENVSFLCRIAPQARIFNISSLKGYNIDSFLAHLKQSATNTDWWYNAEDMTILPLRFLASELTREQLLLKLEQELPYNLIVQSENWNEQNDGSVKINQVIIVSRANHKNIIIGKNGRRIKQIGIDARINIEQLLEKKVHLFLFVKICKNWETYHELPEYQNKL